MVEALWTQNSGVEYSAAEDRRLISSAWPVPGVLRGLWVTPGTGRTLSISAGAAVIADGTGGSYLAAFSTETVDLAVTANGGAARQDGVYIVVDDPGAGEAEIVVIEGDTPAPSSPYTKLATVLVASGATSIPSGSINNAVRGDAGDNRYARTNLQAAQSQSIGGNVTFPHSATFTNGIIASGGVRFGAAAGTTKRFWTQVRRATDWTHQYTGWQGVPFTSTDYLVSDYASGGLSNLGLVSVEPPANVNGSVVVAPITGMYAVSSYLVLDSEISDGYMRSMQFKTYSSAHAVTGTYGWIRSSSSPGNSTNAVLASSALMRLTAGGYVKCEIETYLSPSSVIIPSASWPGVMTVALLAAE